MDTQTPEVSKVRTTPKDFFLHLGIIVALYVSAISLVNLLFAVINKAYPDAISNNGPAAYTIAWTISALVIMFPLYIFLGWLFNKELKTVPEKKMVGIRKWLVYLTLFVAGLTLAIDLIFVLNTFLLGEITVRFILKALAVLVVAGLIFTYYIYDLTHSAGERTKAFKSFAGLGIILVIGSIIAGFAIIGTPMSQRKVMLDVQKIEGLSSIQNQVTYYWQQKNALPKSLSDLENALTGYVVPLDPETKQAYEYQATGSTTFRVCATFSTDSKNSDSRSGGFYGPRGETGDVYWKHGIGKTCFDRTIDKDLFPSMTEKDMLMRARPITQ
jgi:hypothetical protein